LPPSPSALAYDKPLCAPLDGFTLHAATRAGARHAAAREALLRYVLRPPIAQERAPLQQDGLVRLSRRRAFADGTALVDMDPLSLLCRLAAAGRWSRAGGPLPMAAPWRTAVRRTCPSSTSRSASPLRRPRRRMAAASHNAARSRKTAL
jgi:Putative transposase